MKILKERVGVIYHLARFHFWAMIIVWEIEVMRVMIALSHIERDYITIYLAFGLFRFDLLMLVLTIMSFTFSIAYIACYVPVRLNLLSLLISALLLVIMTFGYFSEFNNSASLVYQSLLDIQNFFFGEKSPFFNIGWLKFNLLIFIAVLIVLLILLFSIYYYKYVRKDKINGVSPSKLNNYK